MVCGESLTHDRQLSDLGIKRSSESSEGIGNIWSLQDCEEFYFTTTHIQIDCA
jgi:hypothetical protein